MNNIKDIITKEVFNEIIEDIRIANDYQENLNKFFSKNGADGYIFQPDCTCSVLKLLHLIFGEKDADEWIEHFCLELNFGRKYKEGDVLDKDGKNIPLTTTDDLYRLLTE